MAYQAIESFSAEFADGRPAQMVVKGEIFPDGHELVRRDWDPAQGATANGRQPGQLFKRLNLGEEEPHSAPAAAAVPPKPAPPKPAASPRRVSGKAT